jgi:hypothetical protein
VPAAAILETANGHIDIDPTFHKKYASLATLRNRFKILKVGSPPKGRVCNYSTARGQKMFGSQAKNSIGKISIGFIEGRVGQDASQDGVDREIGQTCLNLERRRQSGLSGTWRTANHKQRRPVIGHRPAETKSMM